MKRLITLVLVATLAVVFACVLVGAQEQRFKVGDRVEVDTFMRGDYEGADKYAEWRKGTVTGFFNPEGRFGGYVVKIDQGREMQIRFVDTRWIRTPQTGDADAKPDAKPDAPAPPVNAKPENANQPPPANAPPADGFKYKVGDRVEVDTMQSSDPRNARYKKATIVGIDDADKAYFVTVDGAGGRKDRYIIRDYAAHWIRDIQGGDAGAKPNDKPNDKPDVTAPPNNAGPPDANNAPANNQPQGLKYKVGDRVEVDIIHAENPANAQWKKGTITEVNTGVSSRAYTVQVDPLPGKVPSSEHVAFRDEDRHLRPFGGAAPKIESDKLRVDENNTVLADRELLDCENLQRGPARNGQRPPAELIKKIIQCTLEHPSKVGGDGATTMDIREFIPGAARKWDRTEDRSIDGTLDTLVFPYHVKYETKTFLRHWNESQTGNERSFNCYVTGNEWFCSFAADGLKYGVIKKVPVQK